MKRPVFRFAPSPNGLLHLGHAFSALLNHRMAREIGGQLLLRLEDIDPARSRPAFADGIARDLAWLGLRWEEPVRVQSRFMADYARAADELRRRDLLFPCFCTRGEIARATAGAAGAEPRDPDGAPLYPGTCRDLSPAAVAVRIAEGRRPAFRLRTGRALAALPTAALGWHRFDERFEDATVAARPERWGDPVIVRRDTPTSYHLSVVVDDAIQGVTHVVRGRDLEAATDLHRLLQGLLGLPSPRYHHHALLRDEDGAKLSKSAGSPSLADLRAAGMTPSEVRARLGFG